MSNGTMEGALDTVSSQVSEAFGRLTHLQDELRARLQTVAERERRADETKHSLDEVARTLEAREQALRDAESQLQSRFAELDHRAADLAQQQRQHEESTRERETRAQERDAQADERDARLTRREDVVDAFQELLAHMRTALESLAPDDIMTALDAGAAYEDRAKAAKPAAGGRTSSDPVEEPKDPIGLTADEQARFFALRDAGKNDAEILAEIYEARTAARNGAGA